MNNTNDYFKWNKDEIMDIAVIGVGIIKIEEILSLDEYKILKSVLSFDNIKKENLTKSIEIMHKVEWQIRDAIVDLCKDIPEDMLRRMIRLKPNKKFTHLANTLFEIQGLVQALEKKHTSINNN